MTVLDDRQLMEWVGTLERPVRRAAYRPTPARPAVAPLAYRGSGVRVSRAGHTRRPVSTRVSMALAGLAALITLWLGFLGQVSGDPAAASVPVAEQLAVVQVQAGETLQQLAARVAPHAPATEVVQRIRELNQLDSASVDAGQTLVAPIG